MTRQLVEFNPGERSVIGVIYRVRLDLVLNSLCMREVGGLKQRNKRIKAGKVGSVFIKLLNKVTPGDLPLINVDICIYL